MKTRKEVDDLKANWLGDPCWDIWNTDGFEDYKHELRAWQTSIEKEWEKLENQRLTQKAILLACSVEIVKYIERLERDIEKLEYRAAVKG
jgi:hypothetical protein